MLSENGVRRLPTAEIIAAITLGALIAWNPVLVMASIPVAAAAFVAVRRPAVATISMLGLGVFFLRPAALGGNFTPVGLALVAISAASLVLHDWPTDSSPLRRTVAPATAGLVLWGYLLLHASLAAVDRFGDVAKAAIAHMLVITGGWLILRNRDLNRRFFRLLVWSLVAVAASYIITFALSIVVPLQQLQLARLPIEEYGLRNDVVGTVYFPFTMLYNVVPGIDVRLLRLMGWVREAGILQAFMIWALFSHRRLGITTRWVPLALLAGMAATFSTSGVVLLPATAALWFLANRSWRPATRIFVMAGMLVGAGLALVYAPVVGLAAKSESNLTSLVDRLEPASAGARGFVNNLGGRGLYSATTGDESAISLLGQAQWLGIVGILLVIAVWAAAVYASEDRTAKAVALFPLLATSLVAQPLLDAPVMFLVMLANHPPPYVGECEPPAGSRDAVLGQTPQTHRG